MEAIIRVPVDALTDQMKAATQALEQNANIIESIDVVPAFVLILNALASLNTDPQQRELADERGNRLLGA